MEDLQKQSHQDSHFSLDKIQHLIEIERYDLAERELRRALTFQPEEALLHVQLGWALEGMGRVGEAEDEARLALRLDPQEEETLILLAKICSNAGRHREAETLCLSALQIDPMSPRNYLIYAALMQKTGHLAKAEKLLRKCLALDAECESAHSALSVVLAEQRKGRSAINHGSHGVALDPDANYSHAMLGYTYLTTGHPFKARAHLREALRISPADKNIEKAFYEADRATRWIYLPMYFWSLILSRLPGQQFALWLGIIILVQAMKQFHAAPRVVSIVVFSYLGLCLYTWIATPLANAWIKLRPAR